MNSISNQLLEFYLTNHCKLQMWDRKISSEEMVQVLKFVEPGTDGKKLAIITPEFLKKRSIKGLNNQCLVIVLKNKLLKTVFWCDHPNYLFLKEKEAEFQLLY